MKFRRVQRLASENSTMETAVQLFDLNAFSAYGSTQIDTLPSMDASSEGTIAFNFLDYGYLGIHFDVPPSPWRFEETKYDISFGVPLIFSISQNAEKLLLKGATLKDDVLHICDVVADFVSARDLKAIGEISVFQEDESEPRLFVTYAILNRHYDEILKIWDEVCTELMKSIPLDSLEKVAIVFDQF